MKEKEVVEENEEEEEGISKFCDIHELFSRAEYEASNVPQICKVIDFCSKNHSFNLNS